MTRSMMDTLRVGDLLSYRVYSQIAEEYTLVPAVVSEIYVTSDGRGFSHGGKHSVLIRYQIDGRSYHEVADNDLAELIPENELDE